MKNLKPLVSIIIPVYNMEEYLDNCIKSIIRQTYSNFEILLIDDGSTDQSKSLCICWEKRDNRIRFFNHDNHGVSYTRNRGLKESRGEYIIFIDADDIVFEKYIEMMLKPYEEYNIDLSILSYFCFYENDIDSIKSYTNNDYEIISDNIGALFFAKTDGTICSKMFRKSIIDKYKINFYETIYVTEDLLFNMQYASRCHKASFNTSKLYGYRQRSESAVHKVVSEKWFTCLDVYNILANNYKESDFYSDIIYYYLKFLYEAKYNIKKYHLNVIEIRPNLYKEIKDIEKKSNIIPLNKKIRLFICKYFFFLIVMHRRV